VVHKLKSRRGETLIELLASILIASLSVALVFGAVTASAAMDRQAHELDGDYYKILSKAEGQTDAGKLAAPPGAPALKVTVEAAGEIPVTPDVVFYGGEGAVSYALHTP